MRVAVVTLGRFGDICNSLPIAWALYQAGCRVTFVVSREHESILDGVGYVDRIVFDGHYSNPMGARAWVAALAKFDQILVPQCYGQGFQQQCASFCEEAWRLVGMRDWFGQVPLVFDRRSKLGEATLIPNFTKPVVLVSCDGLSSPFEGRASLFETLVPLRQDFDVVDLSLVKAPRFFDLLGLMERAAWLVAIDSGPLHLAQAVPGLDVAAIITDRPTPWYGTPARSNHKLRIRYGEFNSRRGEIVQVIKHGAPMKLIHVWSDYTRSNPESIRRYEIARQTWDSEFPAGEWTALPIHEKGFPRNARLNFAEQKAAPFFNDLIDKAVESAKPGDLIVFTNDDTCMSPGAGKVLRDEVPKCGAAFGSRREVGRLTRPLTTAEIMSGGRHVGADVFAFTADWWNRWKGDMPLLLIAFEAFDLVLRKLITLHGGRELPDLCYHENHLGDWTKNRFTRGAIHNRTTAGRWLVEHGVAWGGAFAVNTAPKVWPIP